MLEWIVRVGALVVIPPRRSPSVTRSWLLLIFFLPIPGVLLFLVIGNPRFPAWRTRRFHALRSFFAKSADRLASYRPELGDATPISRLAMTLGFMPATGGNTIELIDDYDAAIARLVTDIDAATVSVHLLIYIFADDAVGHRVIAALGRAVERGVQARVMFDAVGSRQGRRQISRLLVEVGVDVQQAMPFRLLRRLTRRDMRNHRKLFVIDGCIGYAGSQNIVANGFDGGIVNRELVVRVTGPAVSSVDTLVRGDWSLETGELPEIVATACLPRRDAQVQLLPSGADYPLAGFETLLVSQLHQARERVIIITPYFIPDENVLAAMVTAVARGVIVDLVVSKVVDHAIVRLSQESYYDELLIAGVRVHLFHNSLLHAKNLTVDDQLAVVGSSNVDLRSFQLNEEASLLLYDACSIAKVRATQLAYLGGSDTLDIDVWRRRSLPRRAVENAVRLLSPLL